MLFGAMDIIVKESRILVDNNDGTGERVTINGNVLIFSAER